MARGDGIHRTTARNARMKDADIGNAQAHNERQKESYVNQDIVTERTPMNVHFKSPSSDYTAMFDDMVSSGTISTRGLKADAEKFGELIFDVNSAYFFNHGGYDFAKQFYADAYKAAIKIVGGEQYILSAVMHADERNRAMSDALGQNVYHYHLHVIYIPVVEKQILWSKRCKDESLRGTVKETIQQVSMSKKWDSKPALDEIGMPILAAVSLIFLALVRWIPSPLAMGNYLLISDFARQGGFRGSTSAEASAGFAVCSEDTNRKNQRGQ